MLDDVNLIVLVPAYREELTIAMVVMLSKQHADKVIVVDDGSPDRTAEIASMAGAEVLRLEKNQGKAGALNSGFDYCLQYNPRCVVMIDGDGQMDPAQIPIVARPVLEGKADLVIGSRFIGEKAEIPKHRVFGQKMLNKATNIGSDVKVTDSQSGYRALSRKALENLDFDSESYNIESDMIAHFASRGLRIIEVPVTVRYDVPNGHKQSPFRHGFAVMSRIVSYIGYRKPLIIFGIPGIIAFLIGLVFLVSTFTETIIIFNWTLVSQGIAGISAFAIGLFLIFAALVLNSLGMLMDNIHQMTRLRKSK